MKLFSIALNSIKLSFQYIQFRSENDPFVSRPHTPVDQAALKEPKPVETSTTPATVVNKKPPDDFEFKIPKLPSPMSLSACASFESLDKLSQSQKTSTFNAASVPNSFDMFMHDLRQSVSSSSSTNVSHVASSHQTVGTKFLTSSVDKDLNSESNSNLLAKKKNPRAVLKSLDLDDPSDRVATCKTSSPFKRPTIPALTSGGSGALNRTVDIDRNSAIGSTESLNSSSKTTCSSAESFSHMKGFGDEGSTGSADRPSTVLNTTYDAWSAADHLEELEAFDRPQLQQPTGPNSNKTVVFNKTQDFNNNFDDDLSEVNCLSRAGGESSGQRKKRISGNKKVSKHLRENFTIPTFFF